MYSFILPILFNIQVSDLLTVSVKVKNQICVKNIQMNLNSIAGNILIGKSL